MDLGINEKVCLTGGETSPMYLRADVESWQVESTKAWMLLSRSSVRAPIRIPALKSVLSGSIFRDWAVVHCMPAHSFWDANSEGWGWGEGPGLLQGWQPLVVYLN